MNHLARPERTVTAVHHWSIIRQSSILRCHIESRRKPLRCLSDQSDDNASAHFQSLARAKEALGKLHGGAIALLSISLVDVCQRRVDILDGIARFDLAIPRCGQREIVLSTRISRTLAVDVSIDKE